MLLIAKKKNPDNIDKRQKLLDLESRTHRSDDGSIETVTIPRLWEFKSRCYKESSFKYVGS